MIVLSFILNLLYQMRGWIVNYSDLYQGKNRRWQDAKSTQPRAREHSLFMGSWWPDTIRPTRRSFMQVPCGGLVGTHMSRVLVSSRSRQKRKRRAWLTSGEEVLKANRLAISIGC